MKGFLPVAAAWGFSPGYLLAQEAPPGGAAGEVTQGFLDFILTGSHWQVLGRYVLVPAVIVVLSLLLRRSAARRVQDPARQYFVRKLVARLTGIFIVLYFAFVLLSSGTVGNIATIVGLLGAGLAVALQDIIASFVAWFFIIGGRGFKVGDRIRIGAVKGDVVDIGILRSTVMAVRDVGEVEGQATGSLRVFPNNLIFRLPLENYTIGNEYVWNEIELTVTYESDWKKAERIILSAADTIDVQSIVAEAQKKMQLMRRDFKVRVGALTPIVYVRAADSGVALTLRYLCDVRQVRGTADRVTREIMSRFAESPDIAFAYPTMRIVPTPVERAEDGGDQCSGAAP